MALTAADLQGIGFNDPNVISGILADPSQVDRYEQELGLGSTTSGTTSGPDLSGVPSTQDFIQDQFASEDVPLTALIDKIEGQEAPLDIFERLEGEAGLPELRDTAETLTGEIGKLEDILWGIEPQVAATTKESLVTEGQRQGMVQEWSKPFREMFTRVSTALGRIVGRISKAEAGIATKVQLAMQGQDRELRPFELWYSVLTDRNARLLTGFTSDKSVQLEALWAKWERDNELSDNEWNLANTLALNETSYLQSLQKAAASAGIPITGSESADELLGMIGIKADEESGSGDENATNVAFDPDDPDWEG